MAMRSAAMNLIGATGEIVDHAIGHAREVALKRAQQQTTAHAKAQIQAHATARAGRGKAPAAAEILERAAVELHDQFLAGHQRVAGGETPHQPGKLYLESRKLLALVFVM